MSWLEIFIYIVLIYIAQFITYIVFPFVTEWELFTGLYWSTAAIIILKQTRFRD